VKATITSKGQITIPKTIRDILNLNDKDELEFHVDKSGEVRMKKVHETNIALNLIDLFINMSMKIAIVGTVGSGKTTMVKNLVIDKGLKTIVLNDLKEYSHVKESLELRGFEFEEIDFANREKMTEEENVELLVIEEAHKCPKMDIVSMPVLMTTFDLWINALPITPDIIVKIENKTITEILRVTCYLPMKTIPLYSSSSQTDSIQKPNQYPMITDELFYQPIR